MPSPHDIATINSATAKVQKSIERFAIFSVETTGWGSPFRLPEKEAGMLETVTEACSVEVTQTFRLQIVHSLERFYAPGRVWSSDPPPPWPEAEAVARVANGIAAAVAADGWKPEAYTTDDGQQIFEIVSQGERVTLES